MNTPAAISARPSTSRWRWSSTGSRSDEGRGRRRSGEERARRAGRRGALRARVRARAERAGARLRVVAIPRNFDVVAPEPASGPLPSLYDVRLDRTEMNDFSRAPRVLVVEDDDDIAQALQ